MDEISVENKILEWQEVELNSTHRFEFITIFINKEFADQIPANINLVSCLFLALRVYSDKDLTKLREKTTKNQKFMYVTGRVADDSNICFVIFCC